jgi:hypothetical protein
VTRRTHRFGDVLFFGTDRAADDLVPELASLGLGVRVVRDWMPEPGPAGWAALLLSPETQHATPHAVGDLPRIVLGPADDAAAADALAAGVDAFLVDSTCPAHLARAIAVLVADR